MLDACATAAGTAYNEGSPCSFVIPAPYAFTPTTKAGRDAWATALRLKILSNAANQWLMVAAGDDELQDAIGQGSKTLWDSPIIEVAGRACSYPVDKDFGAREDEDAWRGESSYNDFESDIIGDLTCCPVSAEQKTWFSAGWTMSGDETFKRFSNVRLSSQIYRLTKSELRKFANKNLTRVTALFKQSNEALVIGALTPSSATLIQNRVGTALRETNKLLDEPCQVFPDQSDTSKNIYVDIYFKGKEFVNNVFFRIGAY
jgi:hypothetical protein